MRKMIFAVVLTTVSVFVYADYQFLAINPDGTVTFNAGEVITPIVLNIAKFIAAFGAVLVISKAIVFMNSLMFGDTKMTKEERFRSQFRDPAEADYEWANRKR